MPIFIAGGIHASIEPISTIKDLNFDYAFVGEADVAIVQIADGKTPDTIPGIVSFDSRIISKGEEVKRLDTLPFPDWSLCNYKFYAYPSFGKIKVRQSKSLDMMMGRGCVYKCSFCAYNALSKVRFYSAEYLAEQMEYMAREFDINAIYFTDSSIGNNRHLLHDFCELMIKKGISKHIEWYGNIRPNQIDEEQLKLMWLANCRFLFYGFESGSQRVLNLMNKRIRLEDNYKAVELHNKLKFPFHASMLFGYPGEREEDILESMEFMRKSQAPSIGVNLYVPLPGSPDYDKLKTKGLINTDDPSEWRRIGEVNSCRVYADVPEKRFRKLFADAENFANIEIPRTVYPLWGCIAPPQCETNNVLPVQVWLKDKFGLIIRKLKSFYE
jgi:anaerobic magnesium-protoporphyrin IX monomethyl ester cyclase